MDHSSGGAFGIRFYCRIALGCIVIGWFLFKAFFVYPNLVFDSYAYVLAAAKSLGFNAWPIGYSQFIRLFSLFSHSANLLVGIQYFILEISCLLFFLTWVRLFNPGKIVQIVVFVILFVNPILIYIGNFILSDALFISLSVLWVTQLLWIVYSPKGYMLVIHAILLTAAFTVRYNALYYPFVAIPVFLLSSLSFKQKVVGISLPLVLIGVFIFYTSDQVASVTGKRQFSPFGAWKLANDALYVYARVPDELHIQPPERFRPLDSIVRDHFKRDPFLIDLSTEDPSSGSYFMLDGRSPLKEFITFHYRRPIWGYKEWLSVAPLYQEYALYLTRQYPASFIQYFVWPNFIRYLVPPAEVFNSDLPFQLRSNPLDPNVSQLFRLTTISIDPAFIRIIKGILKPFPFVLAISHLVFLLGIWFWVFIDRRKLRRDPLFAFHLIIVFLWVVDLVFSLLSAGVVLRYQLFMMVIEYSFGLYFIERSIQSLRQSRSQPSRILPAGS